ncbi:unnamed protein product [Moneuplotes crassus]|uniref:EamA domain-containing protein n=1 Tax=Euplotes crassus TaxID=5936 RepID=A0AAD1UE99_EUPCR|nr:unnamed protein product [Moneuplotes crassus]
MFLQEPTSKLDIFSLSLGFVGIVLINNPFAEQGQGSNELAGILISSIGGLCSSIGWIVIRKMGGKLHFTVAPFYFSIGCTVTGVLFFLIDAQGTTYNVRYNWADILMILVVSMSSFLGQLMQALAYEYEKAAKVAVFYYFQIFLVFMYDLFIFKTSFGYIEILGAALTISCNFCVALLKFLGYKD